MTVVSDRPSPNVTFAALVLGTFSFSIIQSLVVPALPDIQHAFHSSQTSASWILSAFLLSASVATPLAGRLGDVYGKERMLMVVLAHLTAGTVVCALATSLPLMLAGRAIQGVAGGLFPLAFGIIRDEFPAERVPGAIGLISALLSIGGGLGVILSGPIVDNLSYHFLFWLPLIPITVAIAATKLFVPESPVKAPERINWTAAVTLSLGLIAVLVAITQTPTWHWLSAKTIGLMGVGLILLLAWVRTELRAAQPLVDMAIMRIRGVWTTNAVAFLIGIGMYASFFLLPQYVSEPLGTGYGFGATVTQAGFFMAPMTLAVLIFASQVGRLEKIVGSKPTLLAGAALASAAFVLFAVARSAPWEVYGDAALLGAGIGLTFAALANLIIENVDALHTGVATGMNALLRTLGGAFGGAVTASLLAGSAGGGGYPSSAGYTRAFASCAIALGLSVIIGFAIPRRRTRDVSAPASIGPAAGAAPGSAPAAW